jgi:hypothetical protein
VITEKWYAGELSEEQWAIERKNLLEYCCLDTWAMVEIKEFLEKLIEEKV